MPIILCDTAARVCTYTNSNEESTSVLTLQLITQLLEVKCSTEVKKDPVGAHTDLTKVFGIEWLQFPCFLKDPLSFHLDKVNASRILLLESLVFCSVNKILKE